MSSLPEGAYITSGLGSGFEECLPVEDEDIELDVDDYLLLEIISTCGTDTTKLITDRYIFL